MTTYSARFPQPLSSVARPLYALLLALFLLLIPTAGSAEQASTPAGTTEASDAWAGDDFDDELAGEEEVIWDPLEPVNRGIFWFNDKLDYYILEPIAIGYDYVLPSFAKTGVSNFFDNLETPVLVVSDLVQLKMGQAGTHIGRFLINTTLGIGGLIDVADDLGIPPHPEDFGTALAFHGMPPGPYLMLPFLGPSNFRDTIGTVVDGALNPLNYVDSTAVAVGARALRIVNRRAELLDAVDTAKESSLDYYLFVQSAYYQRRDAMLHDGRRLEEDFGLEDE